MVEVQFETWRPITQEPLLYTSPKYRGLTSFSVSGRVDKPTQSWPTTLQQACEEDGGEWDTEDDGQPEEDEIGAEESDLGLDLSDLFDDATDKVIAFDPAAKEGDWQVSSIFFPDKEEHHNE
jgi:hypothetical protein